MVFLVGGIWRNSLNSSDAKNLFCPFSIAKIVQLFLRIGVQISLLSRLFSHSSDHKNSNILSVRDCIFISSLPLAGLAVIVITRQVSTLSTGTARKENIIPVACGLMWCAAVDKYFCAISSRQYYSQSLNLNNESKRRRSNMVEAGPIAREWNGENNY